MKIFNQIYNYNNIGINSEKGNNKILHIIISEKGEINFY